MNKSQEAIFTMGIASYNNYRYLKEYADLRIHKKMLLERLAAEPDSLQKQFLLYQA